MATDTPVEPEVPVEPETPPAPVWTAQVIITTPNVLPGQMATFAITTNLIAPWKYQWKKDGVWIGGAGSSKSYTTAPLGSADFRSTYSCTVWGQDATIEAAGAVLNPNMKDPTTISNAPAKGKS